MINPNCPKCHGQGNYKFQATDPYSYKCDLCFPDAEAAHAPTSAASAETPGGAVININGQDMTEAQIVPTVSSLAQQAADANGEGVPTIREVVERLERENRELRAALEALRTKMLEDIQHVMFDLQFVPSTPQDVKEQTRLVLESVNSAHATLEDMRDELRALAAADKGSEAL